MVLPSAVEQTKSCAELAVETLRAVSHHLQAAAPGRSIRPEAGYDHVAPGTHDPFYLRHITGTIARISEEVKHGAVMPYGTGYRG